MIFDERRCSEARLERAWKVPSRDAALFAFGVLAVPVHFIKTRGWLGVLLGLAAAGVVLLASTVVLEGIGWALGWE